MLTYHATATDLPVHTICCLFLFGNLSALTLNEVSQRIETLNIFSQQAFDKVFIYLPLMQNSSTAESPLFLQTLKSLIDCLSSQRVSFVSFHEIATLAEVRDSVFFSLNSSLLYEYSFIEHILRGKGALSFENETQDLKDQNLNNQVFLSDFHKLSFSKAEQEKAGIIDDHLKIKQARDFELMRTNTFKCELEATLPCPKWFISYHLEMLRSYKQGLNELDS